MLPLKDDIPSYKKPIITPLLIGINVIVFLYQFSLGPGAEGLVLKYGAIPYNVTHLRNVSHHVNFPIPLTLFTAMFLHGGFLHLLGNMLYLWIFGDNVEDRLGKFKFILLYLVSGLIAGLSQVLISPKSTVPMIGASGAIAGVLGAYMVGFPYAKVLTLVFFGFFARIIRIPAFFVLGFWFILQIIYALPSLGVQNAGGVAFFAHIGGFLAGILLFYMLR
ncbi:MAG TPA: rhomboid family intramembrane serine protease [Terriglobales bacterium]|nr:rhomboid family intramembrane serine protease [Terriglobales bacterium]